MDHLATPQSVAGHRALSHRRVGLTLWAVPVTADHVIILNDRHLKRLMSEHVSYYHEDRTHLGLAKDIVQRSKATFAPSLGLVDCPTVTAVAA